jgi:hypothetical protein
VTATPLIGHVRTSAHDMTCRHACITWCKLQAGACTADRRPVHNCTNRFGSLALSSPESPRSWEHGAYPSQHLHVLNDLRVMREATCRAAVGRRPSTWGWTVLMNPDRYAISASRIHLPRHGALPLAVAGEPRSGRQLVGPNRTRGRTPIAPTGHRHVSSSGLCASATCAPTQPVIARHDSRY